MRTFLTLMQREWLQHRFGWSLLTLVPLGLALLVLSFGQIQVDSDAAIERVGHAFPAIVTAVAMMATTGLTFIIVAATSLILISGLARRDHQDRSVEFWLSLPTGHSSSLAAPLVTHLLVAPAAALFIGLAGGWLFSLVVVTRLAGLPAWLALPWGDIVIAVTAMLARVLVGLPLAVLWAAPLVLAQVLANAYFKRWGLPVLLLLLAAAGLLVDRWLGLGSLSQLIGDVLRNAAQALVTSGNYSMEPRSAEGVFQGLRQIPGWALADLAGAVRALASPLFAGCLATAAAMFALLVDWRRRGAGAAG
jgi:hypothetical protein